MRVIPLYFMMGIMVPLLMLASATGKMLFDGQWSNYTGPFYGTAGWHNGTPVGHPTGNGNWSDFTAFWAPVPLGNTWLVNVSWAEDRIRLERDPLSPTHGLVARFEVDSGDHPPGYHSGERSEMCVMLGKDHKKLPVTAASGHEFYGVSVKVARDWKAPQQRSAIKGSGWGTFMQLHSPNVYDSPPSLDLMAEDDFHLNMDAGDLDKTVPDPKTGQTRHVKRDSLPMAFSNGDLRRGHWVQFVMDVVWAPDTSGAISIYRRDEGEQRFVKVLDRQHVPTLQTDSAVVTDPARCASCAPDNVVHYWRVGFYRSTSPGQTNVLWLGPVVRATTFDEAERAAFGTGVAEENKAAVSPH